MNGCTGMPQEILMVDDSPADIRLAKEAFRASGTHYRFHVATDGDEAIAYLRSVEHNGVAPRPALVLLDLNLPRKNGHEVLTVIKTDESLKSIPVIVLTLSSSEEDIIASYNLQANCYVTKPMDLDLFFAIIRSIERLWLQTIPGSRMGEKSDEF